MRKKLLLLSALMISINCFSQSELPDFVSSKEKGLKKVKLDMPSEGRKYKNGTGYSLNPKLLKELPKKVALVSFYSFDPGITKTQRWISKDIEYQDGGQEYAYDAASGKIKKYNIKEQVTTTTYHTKVKKINAVGSSGDLALGYYVQSISAIVDGFKEYGIDLLLPNEYLDTEEKKNNYENYKVERAKFNKFTQSIGSGGHDEIYGYIEGYNVIDIVNEPFGNYSKTGGLFVSRKGNVSDNQVWVLGKCGKMVGSLGGDLCTMLEVDAVVIVYFTIYAPSDRKVILQNVNMHMFGPNPTPLPEGKTSKFNYFPGQFYCGTRINPEVVIWNYKKKVPETHDLTFAGFDNIMSAMIIKMGTYLKEGIEKGKK